MATVSLRLYNNALFSQSSVKARYAAQAATECALYFAVQDENAFTGTGASTIACNGGSLPVAYDAGTYTFTVPILDAEATVAVSQNTTPPYGLSMSTSGRGKTRGVAPVLVSREQKVTVAEGIPRKADIMLLIDNSNSISGSDRDEMRAAIMEITAEIQPYLASDNTRMGIIEFGTLAGVASTYDGHSTRVANVGLTDTITELEAYTYPIDHSGRTNISQALAVAMAEFSGHRYTPGEYEEELFSTSPDFSGFALASGDVRDRDDSEYPDYIILLTDGSPTMMVSHYHGTRTFTREPRNAGGDPDSGPNPFTRTFGTTYPVSYINVDEYAQCNDNEPPVLPTDEGYQSLLSEHGPLADTGVLPHPFPDVNDYPNNVRCNVSMIADQAKVAPFNIGVFVVGIGLVNAIPIGTEEWLRDRVATGHDFYNAADFHNIVTSFTKFFVKLTLTDFR